MSGRCNYCLKEYDSADRLCPHCGYDNNEANIESGAYLRPGTELCGRYTVGQVIASVGFSIIYKAWDNAVNSFVAIKEFYPSKLAARLPGTQKIVAKVGCADEFSGSKQRFIDEAVNISEFSGHENIAKTIDGFEENNTFYYVLEGLQGSTLSEYMGKHKELSIQNGIDIILKVGNALKTLHAAGILCCDVNPDNIIIPEGYPDGADVKIKIFDFSASRFSSSEKKRPWIRVIKPGYSPPEQYGAIRYHNEQMDIYALGANLYYMLTGLRPDESTGRKIKDELPPPHVLNSEIPEHTSNAILRAMALDLQLRFKTIAEFENALTQKKTVMSPADEIIARKKKRKRSFTLAISAMMTCIAILCFFIARELDNIILPEASISMWYYNSGDQQADKMKSESLAAVIEAFNESFPKVSVELKGIEQASYADEIYAVLRRGGAPVVLETTIFDKDMLDKMLEVGDIIGGTEKNECYFLDKYARYFPSRRQIPIGFNVSAFYINPLLCEYDSGGVKSTSELLAAMPLTTAEKGLSCSEDASENYHAVFGAASLSGSDSFFAGETGAYFSDTSEFYSIMERMPARFKVLCINDNKVPAEFCGFWSVIPYSGAEQKAAKRLLRFMLSCEAQDILHIRGRSGALPLNKQAMAVYSAVYGDYDGFFSNTGDYSFSSR